MRVVTAGMHQARSLAAVVTVVGFKDSQRIDVAANGYSQRRLCIAIDNDASILWPKPILEPSLVQYAGGEASGFEFGAARFGMRMQVTAYGNEPVFQRCNRAVQSR